MRQVLIAEELSITFMETAEFSAKGGDAYNLPGGIYFYRLKAGSPSTSSGHSFVETKKMILVK